MCQHTLFGLCALCAAITLVWSIEFRHSAACPDLLLRVSKTVMVDAVQALDHAMLARGNVLPRLLELSTSPQASCSLIGCVLWAVTLQYNAA